MKFLDLEVFGYLIGKLKETFATKSQGAKADTAVQSVKIGSTEYKSGTNVVLPEYPTTLPASDVADWAKEAEKPTYTANEVDAYSKNEIDAMELVSVDDINNLSVELTQAEYDALVEAGTVDSETVYYITDADGGIRDELEIINLEDYETLEASGDINPDVIYFIPDGEMATEVDASTLEGNTVSDLLSMVYPVGSIYVSNSNVNPSTKLGGTWGLIDKEYKPQQVTATVTQTNTSTATVYAYLSGHDIQLYIGYTPSVELTDSVVELFTIDPASCGAKQFSNRTKSWSAFSDGGQAAIVYNLTTGGVLSSVDVMIRGSSTASFPASTAVSNFNSILIKQTAPSYMLDSFCNKFYWKRTA